jgi:mono/diheme cytochrome c family protein
MILVACMAILLAACATSTPTPNPLPDADLERGRDIYETGAEVLDRGCIMCHTLDGTLIPDPTNPDYPRAPSLQNIREAASKAAPEMTTVEYMRQSIKEPGAVLAEGFYGPMLREPGILLSDEDIDNVIAYVLANTE